MSTEILPPEQLENKWSPQGPEVEIISADLVVTGTTDRMTQLALGRNRFEVPSSLVNAGPPVTVTGMSFVKNIPGITYVAWLPPGEEHWVVFHVPPESITAS